MVTIQGRFRSVHVGTFTRTGRTTTTSATVFTGTAKSGTYTYMSTVAEEDWDVWPPIRSVKLPVRFGVRCRSIRAILTDIQHCEIVRIAIMGDLTGTRET